MSESVVNFLVCVNAEKYSEVALHYAAVEAKKHKGMVTILHVIEPIDYQTLGSIAAKMRQETLDDAENLLNKLAAKVVVWSGITPVFMVKEGLIENEIIATVEQEKGISAIVMGVASDSSVKSKIIPPVVSALGSKLKMPMIIVPGNMTNKQIDNM